jgi:hypothetical protein
MVLVLSAEAAGASKIAENVQIGQFCIFLPQST